MSKKVLLLSFSLIFLLYSCGKSGAALEYNNKIIDIQSKVIKKIISLAESMKSRNPGQMNTRLAELQQQTVESADELTRVPEFEGGEELYNAAMDLFEFYESVCKNEFTEMIAILSSSEITQYDVSRMQELQQTIQQEESRLDRALMEAQRNFAKQHNFTIGANKLQKKIDNM